MSGALVLVDNGLHLAQYEIKKFLEIKDKERQRRLDLIKERDNATQRRKVTHYERKG